MKRIGFINGFLKKKFGGPNRPGKEVILGPEMADPHDSESMQRIVL